MEGYLLLSIMLLALTTVHIHGAEKGSRYKSYRYAKEARKLKLAYDVLRRYGYLANTKNYAAEVTPAVLENAIRDFQTMSGIERTGDINRQTISMMSAPRCGLRDKHEILDDRMAPASYSSLDFKWDKKILTYKILNSPNLTDLSPTLIRQAIRRSFNHWESAADINLIELERESQRKADLEISWGSGNHGDNYPFKRSNILGHAFYPSDGRIHFNDDLFWTWRAGESSRKDLEKAATHEFGHALGLQHSAISGAIMSAWYKGDETTLKLHPDDIEKIQSLYGAALIPGSARVPGSTQIPGSTNPMEPREITIGGPNVCKMKFDDIFMPEDGRFYVIRGSLIYKLNNNNNGVEEGWPMITSDIYPEFPYNPDAVTYSRATQRLYVFKDMTVWRYGQNHLEAEFPRNISDRMLHMTSAFSWKDGGVYIVAGKDVYRFRETMKDVLFHSRLNEFIVGAPYSPDAMVWDRVNTLHVFRGKQYFKIDSRSTNRTPGFPKLKAKLWMNCKAHGVPKNLT